MRLSLEEQMIQLTHYDDGKSKYQSHEVSLNVPHGVNNKELQSI